MIVLLNCNSAPHIEAVFPQWLVASFPVEESLYFGLEDATVVYSLVLIQKSKQRNAPYYLWGGSIQIRGFVTLGGFRKLKLANGSNLLTKYLLQIPEKLTRKKMAMCLRGQQLLALTSNVSEILGFMSCLLGFNHHYKCLVAFLTKALLALCHSLWIPILHCHRCQGKILSPSNYYNYRLKSLSPHLCPQITHAR